MKSMDFTYNGVILNIIKILDVIWFCTKDIATVLEYKRTRDAIHDHVPNKYKQELHEITRGGISPPHQNHDFDR
jgi:prophage antirepressor-like protein